MVKLPRPYHWAYPTHLVKTQVRITLLAIEDLTSDQHHIPHNPIVVAEADLHMLIATRLLFSVGRANLALLA